MGHRQVSYVMAPKEFLEQILFVDAEIQPHAWIIQAAVTIIDYEIQRISIFSDISISLDIMS